RETSPRLLRPVFRRRKEPLPKLAALVGEEPRHLDPLLAPARPRRRLARRLKHRELQRQFRVGVGARPQDLTAVPGHRAAVQQRVATYAHLRAPPVLFADARGVYGDERAAEPARRA